MRVQIKKIAVLFLLVTTFSAAGFAEPVSIATLDSLDGSIEVMLAGEASYRKAELGEKLYEEEVLRTGPSSRAGIVFSDGVLLRLAENTTLELHARKGGEQGGQKLSLNLGKAYYYSREPNNYPTITTPTVTTAIRGTEFAIEASASETKVAVIHGMVECTNKQGSVTLSAGEQGLTALGKAPTKSILLNPQDAVQWVVYFPALSTDVRGASQKLGSKELIVAAQHLSHGQVIEALSYLEKAAVLIPASESNLLAELDAQKALIALIKNDKEAARNSSAKALKEDGQGYSSLLVSSYVSQADFDLPRARELAELLVQNYPQSAAARGRLAELKLALGDREGARVDLAKALEIDPNETQSINLRGFLALIDAEPTEAEQCFRNSLKLDSSRGLTRVGLGLALIAQGNLTDGRAELERAVYLEPTVSQYRSYLAKAYFEEDRYITSDGEFTAAISLDPKDPTPHLYRAYQELAQNKPVAALRDVESAIALNDNRAVYRSRLMLDQDLGARAAGLAEVFNSLGFTELARVEAIKSINSDYRNFSAHRLLGEGYRTILRDDAGNSERKISNLLAPLSFNLIDSSSGQASINEYNALFDGNRDRLKVETSYESHHDQITPNLVYAGKNGSFGYLLQTDGYFSGGNKNLNFDNREHVRAAGQYQPTADTKFLLDASGTYFRRQSDQSDPESVRFETFEFDLGVSQAIGASSQFIFETTYSNAKNDFFTSSRERNLAITLQQGGEESNFNDLLLIDEFSREIISSSRTSAQYIYSSDLVSAVLGGEYYVANANRSEQSAIVDDELGAFTDQGRFLPSFGFNDLNSYTTYAYSTWHFGGFADLTMGVDFANIDLEQREITPFEQGTYTHARVNPKFGLTIYPTTSTLFRLAYFEGLAKSSLEDNLSLEPTLVGGINQRFTDFSGMRSRNYATGIDQRIGKSVYLGVEGLHRETIDDLRPAISTLLVNNDTELELYGVQALDNSELHRTADLGSAYVYSVLSQNLVASLDYDYSSFVITPTDFRQNVQLNKLQAGLKYFDSSGFFAGTKASWREQSRKGVDQSIDGVSDFWTVDANLGYRLPKRQGSVVFELLNILDQKFTYDQEFGVEPFLFQRIGAAVRVNLSF